MTPAHSSANLGASELSRPSRWLVTGCDGRGGVAEVGADGLEGVDAALRVVR